MKRFVFGCGADVENREVLLESENSADADTLREYLTWVSHHIDARNYAMVFPEHGGRLTSICVDRNPVKGLSRREMLTRDSAWMDSMKASVVCEDFNKQGGFYESSV